MFPALRRQREMGDPGIGDDAAEALFPGDLDDPANKTLGAVRRRRRLARQPKPVPFEQECGQVGSS